MAESKPVILVVDDESSIRESFSLILGKEFKVITAASGEAALKRTIDEKIDLVYLDIRMPGLNGIETLSRLKEIDPGIDVIMVTAVNEVGSAGNAIKLGAKDYVIKPFDVEDILNRTRKMIIKAQSKRIKLLGKGELIGNCRQIVNIRKILEDSAANDSSILITGEKGLETEQIAHFLSSESDRPLTILNIASDFKPSQLFGLQKGSFTGAFEKVSGALEEANGGILFIRNIELLPRDTQAMLASAIKNREILREGSLSAIPIDVRIIAGTSVDLSRLAKDELFDPELINLISRIKIELPPIRQRESDIPTLIGHYAEIFSKKHNKQIKIAKESLDILTSYSWPGNLAELANTIEAAVLSSANDKVIPDDLPLDILMNTSGGEQFVSLAHVGEKMEKAHIADILTKAGHNKEKASVLLGIHQKTLESKLEPMIP